MFCIYYQLCNHLQIERVIRYNRVSKLLEKYDKGYEYGNVRSSAFQLWVRVRVRWKIEYGFRYGYGLFFVLGVRKMYGFKIRCDFGTGTGPATGKY